MALTMYAYIKFRKLRYRFAVIFDYALNLTPRSENSLLNGGRGLFSAEFSWHVHGVQRLTVF